MGVSELPWGTKLSTVMESVLERIEAGTYKLGNE